MTRAPDIFMDTSAVFAGIWSSGGGSRLLLQLGQAQAVRLWIDARVRAEAENVLRRKAPHRLSALPTLLSQSRIETLPPAPPALLRQVEALVTYPADALIVAAAWTANVDYFVTLDRQHLLENATLQSAVPFPLGTPGDCLAWYRSHYL